MKKMMLMIGLVLTATVSAKEVTTEAFDEVRVNIPATVEFVEGDTYGFMVEAKDAIVARAVSCNLKDGVMQFSFGSAAQPGEVEYDEATGTYSYGINAINQVIRDDESASEIVITIISPSLPTIKTSSDYVMIPIETDNSLPSDL